MSWAHRIREFPQFTEGTRDRLQAFVVYGLVPLMVVMVAVLMLQVAAWTGKAKQREEVRAERTRQAVEEIVDEIRDPQSGSTRQETFDRIRQLCESDPGCVP